MRGLNRASILCNTSPPAASARRKPLPKSCWAAWRRTAACICRQQYPQVSGAELDAWRSLSYADLAFEILKRFATDIPAADLKALTHKTYTAEVYRNARAGDDAAQITPLRVLEESNGNTADAAGAVERPDAGVQGHGDAVARQPVRVRAGKDTMPN